MEKKRHWESIAIDAVGYQAYSRKDLNRGKRNQVLMISNVLNAGGHLGIIGVYPQQNPAVEDKHEKQGDLMFPMGRQWEKGITIGMGQTPVMLSHVFLRNLIFDGKANPSFIVSDRIRIEDAPEIYSGFDKRDDVVKPVIKFDGTWSK